MAENTTNSFEFDVDSISSNSTIQNLLNNSRSTVTDTFEDTTSTGDVTEYMRNEDDISVQYQESVERNSQNELDENHINSPFENDINVFETLFISNSLENLSENEEDMEDLFYGNDFEHENQDSDESMEYEENFNFTEEVYKTNKLLYEFLNEDNSNETIASNFIVNKIEIILAILKFSDAYALPNSAVADLCKMFNSFVDNPVIPDSRYLLDKLFYSGDDIEYHAVCQYCKNYIKEFGKDDLTVICTVCNERACLKNPSYSDFFVTIDLQNKLARLFENNYEYYCNLLANKNINNDTLYDFYSGQNYKEFVTSLPENERESYMTLTFNSDGSPIFKSSKFSIWPIQVNVNELPFNIRIKKPLTYALWFGRDKPKMNSFLLPFVNDMNKLSKEGINCNINGQIKKVHVYAICCCVDSVARAPMQGFTQYNGYYGCSWCLHRGELVGQNKSTAVKYPISDQPITKRTEENTLEFIQQALNSDQVIYGVKKATPLILLEKFHIINGFVPDAMHCITLGVAKQFCDYWLDTSNQDYSISNARKQSINKVLINFKVPTQIARFSRSITERRYWKSREWENWILYYSVVVLQDVKGFKKFLKHWILLVQSFYILMKDSITLSELQTAHELLIQFVAETELYYSKQAMTYNVHQLMHLAESVANWGPLWSHNGYVFESGNGKIVRNVHAAKGVINQVCRNLSVKENLTILENHIAQKASTPIINYCHYIHSRCTNKTLKIGSNRFFGKSRSLDVSRVQNINLPRDRFQAYNKLIQNGCVFKSSKKKLHRSNNSFVQLKNNEYVQIIQFLVDEENEIMYTLCKKIQTTNYFYNVLTFTKKIVRIMEDVSVIQTSDIAKLCVFMSINNENYITAVPNMLLYS